MGATPPAASAPTQVRIPFDYPLGDLVVLGGALRELHRCHPGEFDVVVESSHSQYWTHCPHARADPPATADRAREGVTLVSGLYDRALEYCNSRPRHLLQAVVDELNRQLGTRVEIAEFRGEASLSPEDIAQPGPVELTLGRPVPYWIVCNGGKFDRTVKWWPNSNYQKVVDALRDRVFFVQVGREGDYHPRLHGTLDFRGGSDLATLVRLVYWAQGVVCPITSLMHLAAAVPRPPELAGLRPCVVVGGGIEPAHLTAYPGHRFHSTVGALPCTSSGCWKSRTIALGDGDPADAPERLCETVQDLSPRCMQLIEPRDVVRSIETFLSGGTVPPLTQDEARDARRSLDLVRGFALDDTRLFRQTARLAIERQAKLVRRRSLTGNGRGLVTLARGIHYLASAWVMVGLQRSLGWQLPVEVWFAGDRAWLKILKAAFARWDANVRPYVRPVDPQAPQSSLLAAKPEVIVASDFREVLWMDADSFPVRDPAHLFDLPEYQDCGAVFWPDVANFRSTAPELWTMFGLPEDRDTPEVQGGELLFDKQRTAPPLLLARWCNRQYRQLYHLTLGDKDLFRLSFRKLGWPYAMPPKCPDLIDGCLFNTDFSGNNIFQHRVCSKLKVGSPLSPVSGFLHHERCQELLEVFTAEIAPHLLALPSVVPVPERTTPVELQGE